MVALPDRDEVLAWMEAPGGGFRVVLGEPLAGRTAIWREVVRRAAASGVEVLAHGASSTDRSRARSTLQRLLTDWVARARAGSGLAPLRGLRDLEVLVPELGGARGPVEPTRLQGELTAFLRRLGRERPALVAIDDLHLADDETVALLDAVSLALPGLGIVGTWCLGDADGRTPSAAWDVWTLRPVADPALPEGAGGLAGLAHLASSEAGTRAIGRRCRERLARLSPAAREVVERLAVASAPVEEDHVASVSRLPRGEVEAALDELDAARWVSMSERGPVLWIELRAPAWAAAVRETLSRRKLRALHADWLAVPLSGPRQLAHTLGAGTGADDGAADRLQRAGVENLDAGRPREAAEILDAARILAERRGGCPPGLLELLGNALRRDDRQGEARDVWNRALSRDPPPAMLARLRRSLALEAWDRRDFDAAFEHLRAGWEVLGEARGPDVEALLRTELILLDRILDFDRLEEAIGRLEAVATSPEARSEAWQARSTVAAYRGEQDEAVAAAEQAVAEAREAREPFVAHRADHTLNMALLGAGRPSAVLRRIDQAGRRTQYQFFARAMALQMLGRRDALREHLDAVSTWPRVPSSFAFAGRALLLEDPTRIREDLARVGPPAGSPRDVVIGSYLRAVGAQEIGDQEAVVDLIRGSGLVGRGGLAGPVPSDGARLLGVALARTNRLEEAEALATLLESRDTYATEIAALLRAEVARARGRVRAGPAFEACARAFEARQMTALAARTRLQAVEALVERSPDRAHRLLEKAWTAAIRARSSRDLAWARELYRALGEAVPATPRRAATEGPLSPRELEVVRLVARGLTNKEVGRALFVSPSTVATHLKRIYRRLDVHSRAALTRWAAETGHLHGGRPSHVKAPQAPVGPQ